MVENFFKYEPGLRKLKHMIGVKLFNAHVDAVSLLPHLGKKIVYSRIKK